ncbi:MULTISPECIES: glycoside hydrolase family 127 protein [unclassified Oceanispirochaeta]|uniref:glycoside hydrolase family 127 protein n=1 Tax=unclassified Oceanispirochaeta TaxID=2635722 RepID=UPI000E09C7C7|nr:MULTISPECIES: beta-L-arabinofuranosidase domain-containing protein [unclassified Oceanispirochaeta]MBF9015978.1 glycoside hydrolase family 127 protein [Oceanispirochaeta sp. M2]NPD72441.1 glycoside hydrolase family 127 protein [Oceanispirochaeta sp. M1]RDG31903.1 glycoside hydrolase family 127 protein [Oceanispirochaeta sp. M1]
MIKIKDQFWSPRRDINRTEALINQWEQYCRCGTLENFRLIAEGRPGKREGFFYTDSDAHKWADAASRVLASDPDEKLEGLLDEYIDLMARSQEEDGYLFTWNQLYFPGTRWVNMQVEHELYTAGHFIEAGISHLAAMGKKDLFNLALNSADLVVKDFTRISSASAPGHQEIEIALLKLYRLTGKKDYLNTAEQFLLKRGHNKLFGFIMLRDFLSHTFRSRKVRKLDKTQGSKELGFEFGENIQSREPRFLMVRSFFSFLDGSYQQQHQPLLKQTEAKGHSVRWAYMMYAAAILASEKDGDEVCNFLEKCWENLVTKKMYITGGIGSLPVIEGFGRDYELNNEFSYSETCAAIGSIFWNNEMLRLSPQARFADLVERQLYNAASVGISQDGKKYFYRNPLESNGELERHAWFETACCPSNISRLWADIHNLIYLETEETITINQYIGSSTEFEKKEINIEMESGFPWEGKVRIKVSNTRPISLQLRIPGWADSWEIRLNNELYTGGEQIRDSPIYTQIMQNAHYETVMLSPGSRNLIELDIPMEILANRSDSRVRENRGKRAISRGPLIYCVESENDIDSAVDISRLRFEMDHSSFTGSTGVILNDDVSFIPYFLWGNRGKRKMKVWVDFL